MLRRLDWDGTETPPGIDDGGGGPKSIGRRVLRAAAWPLTLGVSCLVAFGWASGMLPSVWSGHELSADPATPQCTIKGNISIDTRERIYHLPGQKFYDTTHISPERGERWFCTETDARRAGWRKAIR